MNLCINLQVGQENTFNSSFSSNGNHGRPGHETQVQIEWIKYKYQIHLNIQLKAQLNEI